MASHFTVEAAREEDLSQIGDLVTRSFVHLEPPFLETRDTVEGRKAVAQRHLAAWREHERDFAMPCAVKCTYTDPSTGTQKIVGFAEWFIYDKPRTKEQYTKANFLLACSWLAEGQQRERAANFMKPITEQRAKWMAGRPCAIVMYVAADKEYRRKGIATQCMQWGLERCRQLDIPAYLEASEEGAPVYKRLGFEVMGEVSLELDGEVNTSSIMIWWPPGTEDKDKKPALP